MPAIEQGAPAKQRAVSCIESGAGDVHEEVLAVGREGQRGGDWGLMGWEGGCWMSEGLRHALN